MMTEKRKTPAGNEEEYRDFNPENYIPAEDARQRKRYIPFPQYQTVAEEASFYPSQTASDATGNSTEVTTHAEQPEQNVSIAAGTSTKRTSSKQRKLSLEEYRATYKSHESKTANPYSSAVKYGTHWTGLSDGWEEGG